MPCGSSSLAGPRAVPTSCRTEFARAPSDPVAEFPYRCRRPALGVWDRPVFLLSGEVKNDRMEKPQHGRRTADGQGDEQVNQQEPPEDSTGGITRVPTQA